MKLGKLITIIYKTSLSQSSLI